MRHHVYNVRYSVVPINFSLLTITLNCSVITTLTYNDTMFGPFHGVITELASTSEMISTITHSCDLWWSNSDYIIILVRMSPHIQASLPPPKKKSQLPGQWQEMVLQQNVFITDIILTEQCLISVQLTSNCKGAVKNPRGTLQYNPYPIGDPSVSQPEVFSRFISTKHILPHSEFRYSLLHCHGRWEICQCNKPSYWINTVGRVQ